MLETALEILARLVVIAVVFGLLQGATEDRDKNPKKNGAYFAAFPFYIFIASSYRDYGESKIDFIMPIIINSIIFGFIAFLIGYMIVKFKK